MSDTETDLVEIIREAVRRIGVYTADLTPDTFLEHQMAIDAVALNLLVIGECAKRLSAETKLKSTQPWAKMVALRHRIAHGYTSVDPVLLWRITRNSLPDLARELDILERR